MGITISVTREDIEHGKPSKCFACPVSNALNRLLLPHFRARSGILMFSIYEHCRDSFGKCSMVFHFGSELPLAARNFISNFDKFKDVEPFAFELDIPSKYLKSKGES